MSDSDGIEEAVEMTLRVAVMAAAQIGERRARDRETAARAAQAESRSDARALEARLASERSAGRAVLAPVVQDQWWDTASSESIAAAYEYASAWAGSDPKIGRLKEAMDVQLHLRYGIDPAGGVNHERLDHARSAEPSHKADAAAEVEAVTVLATASRLETGARAAQPDPVGETAALAADGGGVNHGEPYDSTERRERFARSMTAAGVDADVVQSRIVADVSQGAAATLATANTDPQRPRARKAVTRAGAAVAAETSQAMGR